MVRPERAETNMDITFYLAWDINILCPCWLWGAPGSSPVTAGAGGVEGEKMISGQVHVEPGRNLGLWPQYTDG